MASEKELGKELSRRQFLQWGTGAVATLAFAGRFRPITEAEAQDLLSAKSDWVYTCCNMCGGQSGMKVRVMDGVVREIYPNDFNPIGLHNISSDFEEEKSRGARLCPKGNSSVKSLYDPDRLKTPMRRVGPRGSGQWEAISWEEALDYAAKRLGEIKDKYGSEALVWFSEDHSFTHPQQDFCKLFGTPNYHNHSNLCDVARKRGFSTVMGDERPLPDFANTDYMLIFGWNLLGAMKWAHLPAIVNRGRERGAKMVVVDPVFQATAVKADEWVPIRPGTDGALALAMSHVIVKEGLYDRGFVNQWTIGFQEYALFLEDKTPEWAANVTDVPAENIRRLARELAGAESAVIDAWSGPGHHTNCTQGGRAIAMLSALLALYDCPGGLLIPEKKGAKHRSLDVDKPKLPRVDGLGSKYPFGHGSGIYVEAREAMLTGKPYQPKAAVFCFQNWVMAVPNTKKCVDAINNMEFVMAIDSHMSETAQLADLAIPGTHFLERYDFNANWVCFPSLGLRQPVVKSWINGMTEVDFVMALGRKMGLKDKKGIGFDMTYEQYLDAELKGGLGIGLAELKALPGATWSGGPTKYFKYRAKVKVPEGSTVGSDGVVKGSDGKAVGLKTGSTVVKGFETPSRKIEFYSRQLEAKGYDPLPSYTPPEDAPTPEFPLHLVGWKQAEHTHTRTFNNAWLMEMKPTNPLWMNTATGARLGLNDGDKIIIESPYARAEGTVHLTECIHPETVGLHHGYGHWALGNIAKGKGTADGQFLPGKAEAICGQAVTKEVGVRVMKA